MAADTPEHLTERVSALEITLGHALTSIAILKEQVRSLQLAQPRGIPSEQPEGQRGGSDG